MDGKAYTMYKPSPKQKVIFSRPPPFFFSTNLFIFCICPGVNSMCSLLVHVFAYFGYYMYVYYISLIISLILCTPVSSIN